MYKATNPMFGQSESTSTIRTSDGVCIPFDPANTDYQTYLKWLDAGNVPIPAEEGHTPEPQMPPVDSVTFETTELSRGV